MSDNIKNVVSLYTVPDDQIQYIHAENNVLIFTDTPGKNKLYRGTGKESPLELVGAGEAKYLAETHFIYGNEFNGTQDVSNNLIMTGVLDNSTGKGIFNELNVSAKFITNGLFLDDRTISFKDSSGNNVTLTLDTSTFANLDVETNVITKMFDSVEDVFDQSINDISDDDIGTMYYVKSGTSEIDVPETFILNKNREIIPTSSYIIRKNEPDSSFNYHKGNVIWIDKLYSSGDSNDLDINKGEIGPDDTLVTAQDYKNLLEAVNKLYYILGIDMDAGNVKDTKEGLDAGEFDSTTEITKSNYGVILTDLAINQKTAFSDYDTEEKPDWLAALDEESEDSENKDEENKDDYDTIVLPEDITEIGEHFVKAIRIKRGKYSDMIAMQDYLLEGELVWCFPEKENTIQSGKLYIKTKDEFNKMVMMPISNKGTDNNTPDNDNYLTELVDIEKIDWVNNYRLIVNDDGNVIVTKISNNINIISDTDKRLNPLFYINSLYIGGENSNIYDYKQCSHSFIEISNLTPADINLEKAGVTLQYIDDRFRDENNNVYWKILPLTGTIKAGSTYLIRGAECAPMNCNTTRIKIDSYDQLWIDDDGKPLAFSDKHNPVFALCALGKNNDVYNPISTKYNNGWKDIYDNKKIYDLIGFNSAMYYEVNPVDIKTFYHTNKNEENYIFTDFLFVKYFTMDGVQQATKAFGSVNKTGRDNKKDIYAINLRENYQNNIEKYYAGKASYQNKTIFYNKSELSDLPNMIACSFGKKATDDGSIGATRCFNWISKGYYNEYLKLTDPNGNIKYYESFKNINQARIFTGQQKISFSLTDNKYSINNRFGYKGIYDRYRDITTSGEPFTVHKLIIDDLKAGVYKYQIGKEEGWSNEYTFTVKTDANVNDDGFNFIHHSDQQGFNGDEYVVWGNIAKYIKSHYNFDFTINTGDMTQNGNRINEWLDYYNNGLSLFTNNEQMNTIGNNDLSPLDNTKLGTGNDDSKINPKNFDLFYCHDLNKDEQDLLTVTLVDTNENRLIPANYSYNIGNCHFVCVNSEITRKTCLRILNPNATTEKDLDISDITGNNIRIMNERSYDIATKVHEWLENDLSSFRKTNPNDWIIAYCHEMPFTILTNAQTLPDPLTYDEETDTFANPCLYPDRSNIKNGAGCHWNHIPYKDKNNNNQIVLKYYWLSRLFEKYNVSLVLGGHKHTYCSTLPLKENIVSKYDNDGNEIFTESLENTSYLTEDYTNTFKPKIQLNFTKLKESYDPLAEIKNQYGDNEIEYKKYLKQLWYNNGIEFGKTVNPSTSDNLSNIMYSRLFQNNICDIDDIEVVSTETYPRYVMTQATGYKILSNKELPGRFIPWLTVLDSAGKYGFNCSYYPVTPSLKRHDKQMFPFYINWKISKNKIIGEPTRFSINGEYVFYPNGSDALSTYKLINEIYNTNVKYDVKNNEIYDPLTSEILTPDKINGESTVLIEINKVK